MEEGLLHSKLKHYEAGVLACSILHAVITAFAQLLGRV